VLLIQVTLKPLPLLLSAEGWALTLSEESIIVTLPLKQGGLV
jgi:hypothetical protein